MKNLAITMYRFPGVKTNIYERNVRSFRDCNPGALVDCATPTDLLDPYMRSVAHQRKSNWWHSDKILYDLYRRKPDFEWYMYSEWDVFCSIDIEEMIDPVRDFQVIAYKIKYAGLSPLYRGAPAGMEQYGAQINPLAGVMVRNDAMAKIVSPHRLHNDGTFCEVRLGTLARFHGLSLANYPLHGYKLHSNHLTPEAMDTAGLWHPVKFLVP